MSTVERPRIYNPYTKFGFRSSPENCYKLIVAGSRELADVNLVYKTIDDVTDLIFEDGLGGIIIISGGAKGADSIGEMYADEKGIELWVYDAEWPKYGNSAGHKRNAEMAAVANGCLVFWNGDTEKSGSFNMINTAKKYNLELFVQDIPK